MSSLVPDFPPLLGYKPRQHIASGGQSEVYQALNPSTSHLAALKVVPFLQSQSLSKQQHEEMQQRAKVLLREMRIHETLKHRNVLQLFGGETRQGCTVKPPQEETVQEWPMGLYMILDLADGGDLFDKITPDLGIDEDIAHFYFRQLLSGLKYLGKQGICHRDIKPENCLLDGDGNLKISDFGLATVFKYKGQERLLKDRCGSPPYAAPELAHPAPYSAEPVDIWSSGVLLFALLVGNTPWDEPTQNSAEFCAFIDRSLLQMDPWTRIPAAALDLLLKMLTLDPRERINVQGIEGNDWYRQPNEFWNSETGLCRNGARIFRRMMGTLQTKGFVGNPGEEYEEMMQAVETASAAVEGGMGPLSQQQGLMAAQAALTQRGLDPNASFRGSMQLYSRLSMAPTQKSNSNLSRFFSTSTIDEILHALTRVLEMMSLPGEVQPEEQYQYFHSISITDSSSSSISGSNGGKMVEKKKKVGLGRPVARVKVKTRDRRGQDLVFAIHISTGFLPDEPSMRDLQRGGRSTQGGGGGGEGGGRTKGGKKKMDGNDSTGLSQEMKDMDVDDEDDDDEDDSESESDEDGIEEGLDRRRGQEGFDVTCWKRHADPMELKRVWKGVLDRLPGGIVAAT